MSYRRLVHLPIMDLVQQLIKKCDEVFIEDDSKSFLKVFYKEFFCSVGDLARREDLLLFLDYLLATSYKFHLWVVMGVREDEQARLMELYNSLIIKIRTVLRDGGVV